MGSSSSTAARMRRFPYLARIPAVDSRTSEEFSSGAMYYVETRKGRNGGIESDVGDVDADAAGAPLQTDVAVALHALRDAEMPAARADEVPRGAVGVRADEIRSEHAAQNGRAERQLAEDLVGREGKVEKEDNADGLLRGLLLLHLHRLLALRLTSLLRSHALEVHQRVLRAQRVQLLPFTPPPSFLPAFARRPNRRPNYPRILDPPNTAAPPLRTTLPAIHSRPAGTPEHSRPAGNTATPRTPPDSRKCTCLRGNPSAESSSAIYARSPRERLPPIPRGQVEPQVPREEQQLIPINPNNGSIFGIPEIGGTGYRGRGASRSSGESPGRRDY